MGLQKGEKSKFREKEGVDNNVRGPQLQPRWRPCRGTAPRLGGAVAAPEAIRDDRAEDHTTTKLAIVMVVLLWIGMLRLIS